MKILIAGFQHETNTFAPTKATLQSFALGEGFPPMARGHHVLGFRTMNLPIGGFIAETEAAGHELLPIVWAGASASAHVTADAYETIAGEILNAVRSEGFDAIYLDLHGAMVTEHLDDGEGELLERIRIAIGPTMPIVASLDSHANVTERMLRYADGLVAYRTYPHIDMAETGRRAARLLQAVASTQTRVFRYAARLPFLIPINGMCTQVDPARSLYERLASLEGGTVASLSFAPGFPAADFPECGPVVWGYGFDETQLRSAVDVLAEWMTSREEQWHVPVLTPDEAVVLAIRLSEHEARPVVIADTQDNPGVGGDSNTMGMIRALLRHQATDAAVGLIWDPNAARAAHQAGVGAKIHLSLGGNSKIPGDSPLVGTFEVEHISDGHFRFDGPMMHGVAGELGPVAGLRIEGVRIAVSSVKAQMFDRNLFRVAGIQPEAMKILVNKSSVHFRADFEPIAKSILVAKAPGPMAADPCDLPWQRLNPEMRLRPSGPSLGER